MEGSSSEGRMIRRGGEVVLEASRIRGAVGRDRKRDM